MLLLAKPQDWPIGHGSVALAIGVFDGVHLGHREVINSLMESAHRLDSTPVVCTFDCHPQSIVSPERAPLMIQTLQQRLQAIENLGVAAVLMLPFNLEMSRQTGETFIEYLLSGFRRVKSLSVGHDFSFGHKRSGNLEMLEKLGSAAGFEMHGVPPVTIDGERVSSTRVREFIASGDFPRAARMLGRPYCVAGKVIPGARLGRQIGFPTANLEVKGRVLPPRGVYLGQVTLGSKAYTAALNVGHRPTVDRTPSVLHAEVHLLDFRGDLYGQDIEFQPTAKLRDEKKFENLGHLREQIARDIQQIREMHQEKGGAQLKTSLPSPSTPREG